MKPAKPIIVILTAAFILWVIFMVYLFTTNPFGHCDDVPCKPEVKADGN